MWYVVHIFASIYGLGAAIDLTISIRVLSGLHGVKLQI